MTTTTPKTTPHRRSGFTVLEVVVALALSGMVVASGFAIIAMVNSADRVARDATAEATAQLRTYAVLQRAFTSMAAAQPLPPEPEDEDAAADDGETIAGDDPAAAALDAAGLDQGLRDRVAGLLGIGGSTSPDAGLDERLDAAVAKVDTSVPPHFDLYYEEVDRLSLPRLELVLQQSPLAFGAMTLTGSEAFRRDLDSMSERELAARRAAAWAGSVRGVFELVALDDRGWCLVWQPIDPLGPRTVLLEDLAALQWSVLLPMSRDEVEGGAAPVQGDWVPVHAAYLADDYPDAIGLQFETATGARGDWRFETVTVDPAPGN